MNLARSGIFSTVAFVAALGAACGGSDAPSETASSSSSGAPAPDTSTDGGSGTDAAPTPPEVGGEAPTGIFVSASKGIAGADGAKTRPVKTIAEGLPLAEAKGLPLIVCAEAYAEAITMRSGVTMFGYFECNDLESWKRTTARATIASPTSPAVLAADISAPTRFEGFEVSAPNAGPSSTAASSVGMVVRYATGLELAAVSIRAGSGRDGSDGVEPPAGPVETAKTDGTPSYAQVDCTGNLACFARTNPRAEGSAGGTSTCGGLPGGRGGDGPVVEHNAYIQTITTALATGKPLVATADTAAGGAPGALGETPGAPGTPGKHGADGKNGVWAITADGFVPGDGTPGAAGLPGQGGGGGAGTTTLWNLAAYPKPAPYPSNALPSGKYFGFGGAGGGAGGCGGLAGAPGTGGGASIGLLVVDSQVTIRGASKIESAAGGRAGKGTLGTVGTAGGKGGARGGSTLTGAAGGAGGDGGAAGLSGNGAPGPSIALAYKGARPVLTDTVLLPGSGGAGAPALVRGEQNLPATVAVTEKEHSF